MEKTTLVALLTAYITTLQADLVTAICSRSSLPETFEFLPEVSQLGHPGEALINSYTFSCEGNITQWEAYTSGDGGHPIEFQVWRDLPEPLRYELVGINKFTNVSPTNGVLRVSIPEDQQIQVRPGDFVGIRTTEGTEENGFQIQTSMGFYIHYNLTSRGYSETPDVLRLGSLFALDCFNPAGLSTRLSITPLINAVVNTTDVQRPSSPTPATTGSTLPPQSTSLPESTSLPASTIIAIAVAGALLLILIIVFTITLILVCYCMRNSQQVTVAKQPMPPITQEQEQQQMVGNVAYNQGNGVQGEGIELRHNDAYNDTTGGSNEPYYSRIQ